MRKRKNDQPIFSRCEQGARNGQLDELVHIDVRGSIETPSVDKSSYFGTFPDESSYTTFIYFLQKKSEVYGTVRRFVVFAKIETDEKLRRLRSDNSS